MALVVVAVVGVIVVADVVVVIVIVVVVDQFCMQYNIIFLLAEGASIYGSRHNNFIEYGDVSGEGGYIYNQRYEKYRVTNTRTKKWIGG